MQERTLALANHQLLWVFAKMISMLDYASSYVDDGGDDDLENRHCLHLAFKVVGTALLPATALDA